MTVFLYYVVDFTSCLQCLSQNGSPVDWFIIYKLPEISKYKVPDIREGKGFYYMDVNNPTLVLSQMGMDDSNHAVYYTLQQIYKNQSTMAYVMYNDQPPNTDPSLNHGHTKGTFAFDKNGGFWLIHSTPEFPPMKKDGYNWRQSACTYGQTFICLSMDYGMMDRIGYVFMDTYPKIYDKLFPSMFASDNPYLASIVNGPTQKHVTAPPWYNVTQIVTKGNNQFISYEKFTDFHEDLYDGLLSGKLRQDLLVETWRVHGTTHGDLPSNCTVQYKVYNINTLTFPDKGISFSTAKDHSKWAVSKDQGDWLCIGDINRQSTQFKRGGGQMCFQNHKAWSSFRDLVSETEPC